MRTRKQNYKTRSVHPALRRKTRAVSLATIRCTQNGTNGSRCFTDNQFGNNACACTPTPSPTARFELQTNFGRQIGSHESQHLLAIPVNKSTVFQSSEQSALIGRSATTYDRTKVCTLNEGFPVNDGVMPRKDDVPLANGAHDDQTKDKEAGRHRSEGSFKEEPRYTGRRWTTTTTTPDGGKDEHYWEKRRRNNEAAKRSRERRRLNDMATEAKLLELSEENCLLKNELETFRKILPFANHAPLANALSAPACPTVVTSARPMLTRINSYPTENLTSYPDNLWNCRRLSSPAVPQLHSSKAVQLASLFGYTFPYGNSILMGQLQQANASSPKTLMENLARAVEYPHSWEGDLFKLTDNETGSGANSTCANGPAGWPTLGNIREGLTVWPTATNGSRNGAPTSPMLRNGVDSPPNGERNSTEDLSSIRSSSSCDTHSGSVKKSSAPKRSANESQRGARQPTDRYAERRRRNNEAAKRCRANRRALFESRYKRVQQLERENARIKAEATQLNQELEKLKATIARRVSLSNGYHPGDNDHPMLTCRSSSDTDASTDQYNVEVDTNDQYQMLYNPDVNCRSFEKEQSVA
uniref:BZIP domain-containing protein n=1 Tax=Trichuris muris TaxID=70415 RepID=A0A5S6QC25_TRIMR